MHKPNTLMGMRNAGLAPLETKDDSGSHVGNDANNAQNEFLRTVEEFKAANDERISQLESKIASVDPITEEKVNKINTALDDQQKQINDFIAAFNKRTAEHKDADGNVMTPEQKAYQEAVETYIRKGDQGLGEDEIKALSVGTDPDGGYTVSPTMQAGIDRVVALTSTMRRLASVQQVGSNEVKWQNGDVYAGLYMYLMEVEVGDGSVRQFRRVMEVYR